MNLHRLAIIVILILIGVIGCSAGYQELRTKPVNDSTITHQELIDNWLDYDISYNIRNSIGLAVIAFDPKDDNLKIVVATEWDTISDKETWTEFVKEHTTPNGHFRMTGGLVTPTRSKDATGVREIWGPDNQHYGFIVHQQYRDYIVAIQIDDNILKLAFGPGVNTSPLK